MKHSRNGVRDVAVSDIVFREDLYPRIKTNPETVQKYAEDLSVLPPIEINQLNQLIDGWHRWTAHKQVGAAVIPVIVTATDSESQFLELAIERNATHGLQLSQEDKRDMARQIYNSTPESEREEKKKKLAHILSVSDRTVRDWLSRIDKDMKEKRDRRIFEFWMQCFTQDEIAAQENLSQDAISLVLREMASLPKLVKLDQTKAEHVMDFEPPIYDVWKQQEKTDSVEHFGNTEVRFVDNLLYLYTEPFDVVVDPFAGSGSTLDICRKRFRRCWVSDRKPKVSREKEIRKWDLTDGLPLVPRWKDVKLIYLDPPYWKQAEGQYSKDPTDLANMSLDEFTDTLADVIRNFAKKLSSGAVIALMMQPTQWKAPEHQYTDHLLDIARLIKLPVDMRFSVPYESQQSTAQMVEWAKANKKCLVLTRELIAWRVE